MPRKSESDVALEMYESVMQSNKMQRRLKSSTFWNFFHVKSRHPKVVERIAAVIDEQGLKITVRSGATFGKEKNSDWIILTRKFPGKDEPPPPPPSEWPPLEWFEMMQTRDFESEREVEAYFVIPLLEALGYEYDDIAIGHPVQMFKGVQRTKKEADFVVFKGADRTEENVLLVIEAKKSDKGVSVDHIGQARSYARALLPACYIVSNGQQIIVYRFNGMLTPDERVMDFDRSELRGKWNDLYNYVSKEATTQRKQWMQKRIEEMRAGA